MLSGGVLYSSASYGNQWYSTTSGAVAGATGQSFIPSSPGDYFDIVTQSGCCSEASDTLYFAPTGIGNVANHYSYQVYPNPAVDDLHIDNACGKTVTIYNLIGKAILTRKLVADKAQVSLSGLGSGIYFVELAGNDRTFIKVVKP